jgi:predicted CopG family antitoxin
MARVAVADDVWADFRALAGNESIAAVLGGLVEREVDRYRARRLKAGQLDDTELADALERARELHDQLAAIVERLEHRLDQQRAPRDFGP